MSVQTKIKLWKGEKHKKWLNDMFNEYVDFLSASSKTEFTQEWEIKSLICFLRYLDDNRYKKITIEIVFSYLNNMNQHFSLRTIYNRSQCLKYFLNWLYDNDKINFNGNIIFPKLKQPLNSNIVSYYTNNEISQVLNSISIKSKNGKRDLAIFSLFAYLGIRRDDVRTLKFENIDWNNNLIKFHQNKTNFLSILPMPKIVKLALIDYIKNARTKAQTEFIFLKDDGNVYSTEYFSRIVNKIFLKSGIDIKDRKYGCHVLRHSLATNMLKEHISMPVISKVLGHAKTDTTIDTYILYDKNVLKELSLEVPKWN